MAASPAGDERDLSDPLDQASPLVEMRVDFLDPAILGDGAPGKLGLTFLPGKHGPSDRYPGLVYGRELATDLAALRRQGVTHLLLLVDDEELARWGDPDIVQLAASSGIQVERQPLVDGTAPATPAAMAALLEALRVARHTGDVAVACMGGVGRTGTVAACALVEARMSPDAAISEVRRLRHPQAVETEAQEAFVREYARWVNGTNGA